MLYLKDICIFAPNGSAMLNQIELGFSWLKDFNLKIKLKKCYFSSQCDFSGSCLISWQNICQPRKGWWSKKMAGAKECQGIVFIPGIGIKLPPIYSELCLHGQMFVSVNCEKEQRYKKEVTTLGPQEQYKSGCQSIRWHIIHWRQP